MSYIRAGIFQFMEAKLNNKDSQGVKTGIVFWLTLTRCPIPSVESLFVHGSQPQCNLLKRSWTIVLLREAFKLNITCNRSKRAHTRTRNTWPLPLVRQIPLKKSRQTKIAEIFWSLVILILALQTALSNKPDFDCFKSDNVGKYKIKHYSRTPHQKHKELKNGRN